MSRGWFWGWLLACAGIAAPGAEPSGRQGEPDCILVPVRLRLSGPARLEARQIRFSVFPSGKRCAFNYAGAADPKAVAFFSESGFRTTVFRSPDTPPDLVKELETAGAEVGVAPWGCKGNYGSAIGANTVQETYDALATSRLTLKSAGTGSMMVAAIAGHYGPEHFPLDRGMAYDSGYGAAFQDCNYLMLSDNKPYMIYLRREGKNALATRPNETVYYPPLPAQFQDTLRRMEKGQIVRFSLRDFKEADLQEIKEIMGPYGKHEQVWHASEGEIGAYEYIKKKAWVRDVRAVSETEVEIVVALERDLFPPFLLAPLSFEFPKGFPLKEAQAGGVPCRVTKRSDAVHMDVPLRDFFRRGCGMSLKTAAPDLSIPDRMEATLTLCGKGLEEANVEWVAPRGVKVSPEEKGPFPLGAEGERALRLSIETTREARFGIVPLTAWVTAKSGGETRTFAEGFDLVVAPRLRAEMDPEQAIPLPKGRSQHFLLHLANGRRGRPEGPVDKFISHKAGPCKGVARLRLPEGMSSDPPEQPFALGEDARATLAFRVHSDAWNKESVVVTPVVTFEGESEPVELIVPGTLVIRDQDLLDYASVDEKGLLCYASWDEKEKGGAFDRAAGNPKVVTNAGAPCTFSNEGAKGGCLSARTGVLYDTYRNVDYQEGTLLCWVRKDPQIRNENQFTPDPAKTVKEPVSAFNNNGEVLWVTGSPQRTSNSRGGITLRRLPGWNGKDGYLQATYQGLCCELHTAQAPFNWAETWRHVAVTWSLKDCRLEIYLDGKLAGKAEPGGKEWTGSPWDRGGPTGAGLQPISMDHGKWCGTCRDEWYIYNRILTPDEIRENLERARKNP